MLSKEICNDVIERSVDINKKCSNQKLSTVLIHLSGHIGQVFSVNMLG